MTMAMDIVVSNRVARPTPGSPMTGGLAAALLPAVKESGVVWFGSSGNLRDLPDSVVPLVEVEAYGRGSIARVDLPRQHYAGFYEGFANSSLWPLLHSRPDVAHCRTEDFAAYMAVNEYVARTLAAFGDASSNIWVHDYHYLPLGRELRKLGVRSKIGFFLHTPFPARRIWAQVPHHRELAESMLAYDLIGFQTDRDRDAFAEMLRHELGLPHRGLTFTSPHGRCRLATFPIGIDTQAFAESAAKATGDSDVQRLRTSLHGSRLIIGVDRVDYSKGLIERMRAFDLLLTRYPNLKRRVTKLQIAVPSRGGISTYQALQADLARMVGEINGRHGDLDWTPVRCVNKGFPQSTLAGLYRMAAVGLITPLRDGMNLVAKEYVAAQNPSDPGVLVLSKFAGAAEELDGAILIDPQNTDDVARRIAAALVMPQEERHARWSGMMNTLLHRSIHDWFGDFMRALTSGEHENVVPMVPARIPALRPTVAATPAWAAQS